MNIATNATLTDRQTGQSYRVFNTTPKEIHYMDARGNKGVVKRDELYNEFDVDCPADTQEQEQRPAFLTELLESKLPPDWTGEINVHPHVVLVGGPNNNRFGVYAVERTGDELRDTFLMPLANEAAVNEVQKVLHELAVKRGLAGVMRLPEEHDIMREAKPAIEEEGGSIRQAIPEPKPVEQQHNQQRGPLPATLLNGRFIRDANGGYHRKGEDKLALVDENDQIRFVDKQLDTFRAAVELAQSKGWQAIEISGSDRFRSEAWLIAYTSGIEVVGYTPTEKDQDKLKDMQKGQEVERAMQSQTSPPQRSDEWRNSKAEAEQYVFDSGRGITVVNEMMGQYMGFIVHDTPYHVVQSIGKNYVIHEKEHFDHGTMQKMLDSRNMQEIRYAGGIASVKERGHENERSRGGITH